MNSVARISFRHDVSTSGQGSIPTQDRVSTPVKSILKPKRNEAKTAITTTLVKTAGIISRFTENNISQTQSNAYFNKILSPERFGFSSNFVNVIQRNTEALRAAHPDVHSAHGRKKPDLTKKLPSAIVDILKEDSNSSIPSMHKTRKYHYHSKKMSLKQRENSKDKTQTVLNSSDENIAPKIVVVSTPLQLNSVTTTDTTQTEKILFEEIANNKTKLPRLANAPLEFCMGNDNAICNKMSYNMHHIASTIKSEKRMGASAAYLSAVVRKPEKLNIGVENGVAFILGSKTRSPYFNTFGHPNSSMDELPSNRNRKWVVNVGNFLDDEITLDLIGNMLTITGSRLPSLNFPELQTVSETISLPPQLDINNLRIYRVPGVLSFLVIQEKQ